MIRTRIAFVVKSFQGRVALPLLAIAVLFLASPQSLRSWASIGVDSPSAAADEHERAQAQARRRAGSDGAGGAAASTNPAMNEAGVRAAFESAQRAKAVLDAGIAAFGGLDALQSIDGLLLVERGSSMQIGQSMTPDAAPGAVPYEESIALDRRRGRMAVDTKLEYSWGPFQQFRLIDGTQGYRVNHAGKTMRLMAASEHQVLHDRVLNVPQFVLLAALDRVHTLRHVGEETIDGRPHRVISAVIGSGADADLRTLAFDRETNLLTRVSSFYADPLFGDTTNETLFTGYASRNGGHKLPGGRLVRRAGQVAARVDYTTLEILADRSSTVQPSALAAPASAGASKPNPAGLDARFAMPAGYTTLPPEQPWSRNQVQTLAKDVYLIDHVDGTNQNVLFVVFNDYVLVVEAPEDRTYRRLGETVMRIIRETVPGKPIRYVAPTHHHSDHGIGVRPYMAEGVTIVTTPGNASFVRDLANLKFELRPDALALKPRAPVVEVIENKVRVFRDASHIVELHDFGPESHVKESLAVWLPNERILFTGDVIETGYAETARWDGKGKLADILARYKWDVETIATAHSRTRKLADMRPAS